MKNFETLKLWDGTIVNTKDYIKQFLLTNPDSKIVVGCDSQQYNSKIKYSLIVALFYPESKGAHLLYKKFKLHHKHPKLNLYDRLWKEIETVKEFADYIEQFLLNDDVLFEIYCNKKDRKDHENFVEIHIDLNENPRHKSNVLLSSALGYLTAFGYIVMCKPNSWVASCAADLYCK